MGFSAVDIIIYQIFSLTLFLPKTVHDKFRFTTNNLATVSFPNFKNLKPTALLTLHWERIILQTFSFSVITALKWKYILCYLNFTYSIRIKPLVFLQYIKRWMPFKWVQYVVAIKCFSLYHKDITFRCLLVQKFLPTTRLRVWAVLTDNKLNIIDEVRFQSEFSLLVK